MLRLFNLDDVHVSMHHNMTWIWVWYYVKPYNLEVDMAESQKGDRYRRKQKFQGDKEWAHNF